MKTSPVTQALGWLGERLAGMLVDGKLQQLLCWISPFLTSEITVGLVVVAMAVWALYWFTRHVTTKSTKIPQVPPKMNEYETHTTSSTYQEIRADGSVITVQTSRSDSYCRSIN